MVLSIKLILNNSSSFDDTTSKYLFKHFEPSKHACSLPFARFNFAL